jgi:hypothetical protein
MQEWLGQFGLSDPGRGGGHKGGGCVFVTYQLGELLDAGHRRHGTKVQVDPP